MQILELRFEIPNELAQVLVQSAEEIGRERSRTPLADLPTKYFCISSRFFKPLSL